MLNKASTSTGLILLGLSSLANVSSSNIDDFCSSPPEMYSLEFKYNAPKTTKTNVDMYVESNYKMDENLANKYSVSEYAFMNVVQKFAENQIELDEDFNISLDELFISKINSKPIKKRF
jgi:hypothetical protein